MVFTRRISVKVHKALQKKSLCGFWYKNEGNYALAKVQDLWP